MDACLATKTHYIDTANYEPEDTAKFEYKWQWAYREKFKEAGITALLGSGFDPGVTGVFSAYALKHEFDEINYIDILDCNGGDHGYPFATNFNPEINIREVSANGSYWEDGHWVETKPMEIKREYDFDGVGMKDMYLLHHEEIESLALNMPGIKRIRFFMTFGQSYLTHLKVSGERRHDFDRADYVRRKRDRTAAVLKGSASGSGIPWSSYCWKNEYRMHFPG